MNMETYEIENGLLLHCLGVGSDEMDSDRLERLSPAGWDELICRADMHSVAPLLFQSFRTANMGACIPARIMQELQEIYLASSWENSERYHELLRMLKALNDRGIPIIVLKGAALAASIYPSIALRPMCDVDVLIRDGDIWEVDEVLLQLGYRVNMSSPLSDSYFQVARHVDYKKACISIQIHSRLPEIPNLDPWANASPAGTDMAGASVLGQEDFLLHLCLHLNKHLGIYGLTELIRWYDVFAFLKHYGDDFDWNYVIRVAREHRVGGIIHGILRAVGQWWAEVVPAEIVSQFEDTGVTASVSDAPFPKREYPRELGSLLSGLRKPTAYSKARYVFRKIFPCKAIIINHYSIKRPGYVCFYYPVRVAEVAFKAVRAACQLPGYLRERHIS